ncbi:hypothetical protein [Methylomicrobium lacus]|uniref:hypothetical protein n=1 Tax=Methylomicrobium lacus TaxID=136992 RepID=UPI0035A866D1
MKHILLKSCLLAAIFNAPAYADTVSMTESLNDKLKCTQGGECTVETVGKFNVTAKIDGTTFEENGILLNGLNEDTPIEISVGDYSFTGTLADADSATLTGTKIAAKWLETYDECLNDSCERSKTVIPAQVSVSGGLNGMVLKIAGKSKVGDFDEYGSRAFADYCDEAGDGAVLNEDATLSVDGTELSGQLEITCKVKTKTVTKNDESFDLVSTTVRARLLGF